jgi:peptidoglycan hydrolase-like protein with peptidoglycan-binding domain
MSERGWPSFMDGIDERRRRKAREGSGKRTPPPEWQHPETRTLARAAATVRRPGHPHRPGTPATRTRPLRHLPTAEKGSAMRKKIAWISSAATAGGLLVAGFAVAASPGTGHAPAHAVLAATTASSPAVNLDNCPTLAEGYQGGCVNQLQTELNSIDNAGLPVDGIFGPQTQQAVITFQQQNGVSPADGIVGPLTKAALDKASPSPSQPGTPTGSAVNLDNCPTLAEGYQGGCVNQLQTELNSIDNAGLPVDGIFGPQTQQAVITFQQDNGVSPADGIVGPLTKAALNNANSVATPQPGAPLSALQICEAQGGQISDGHGGCTHDGTVAQGKSPSDCAYEATIEEAKKLIAEGLSADAAKILAKEGVKKLSIIYDVGSAFYCILLAPPNN